MEVELKSEQFLNMLQVKAVNFGGSAGSTKLDKLVPADIAAALGMISDSRHRVALGVCAGLGDERDSVELRKLVRENITVFDWGKTCNMRSSKFRVKLDRATCCAIDRLKGLERKKGDKANCIGVSRDNYRLVWQAREDGIYKLILEWGLNGDSALSSILSDRFLVA